MGSYSQLAAGSLRNNEIILIFPWISSDIAQMIVPSSTGYFLKIYPFCKHAILAGWVGIYEKGFKPNIRCGQQIDK